MTESVEIAIVGTGSAGMKAYKTARKQTDSIKVFEADQYGTTCARVGCMPSKLLIAPAEARHRVSVFEQFGLSAPEIAVDGAAVMKRVREERDRFVSFVKADVEKFPEQHRVRARARFIDNHHLEIDNGARVRAEKIIICTGSSPRIPEIYKQAGDALVTSSELFYWESLPQSIAVVGTGVIALELGQALARLGVRTTILGRSESLGFLSDPSILEIGAALFKQELNLVQNAEVLSVQPFNEGGTGVEIKWRVGTGEEQSERFEKLLVATGRSPNVENLGLENTDLQLNNRGIPVFDPETMQCQTTQNQGSHIFIAGDATGVRQLLHEAADDGSIAAQNALSFPEITRHSRKPLLAVMFTDPQIAVVGKSYAELTAEQREFATGSKDFGRQGRARVMLVNRGHLNIYGDRATKRVLGAEMIGPAHEHLAHLISWAIQLELTVQQMLDMPYYHPVIEEGLRDALYDLRFKLKQSK